MKLTRTPEYNELDFFEGIEAANQILYGIATRTSVRDLAWLQRLAGVNAVAKLENEQVTGSFKFRGAYSKLASMPQESKIITASAGNHALAIAEASKRLRFTAEICIPESASQLKRNRLEGYSHGITPFGTSLDETIAFAKAKANKSGQHFISPYNDPGIIYGQGTIAIEFLQQVPDLDTIVVPVGGGGLISGIAIAAKRLKPSIKIIGVQSDKYTSIAQAKNTGLIIPSINRPTFADGLAVNLEEEAITLEIINTYVDEIITVTEEEIAAGVLAALHHESQLLEGAGGAGLGAILAGKITDAKHGKIGIIFSGGNISTSNIAKILHYPFQDQTLVPYLNRYGERLVTAAKERRSDQEVTNPPKPQEHNNATQVTDSKEDSAYLNSRFQDIKDITLRIRLQLAEYIQYCQKEGLEIDTYGVTRVEEVLEQTSRDSEIKISLDPNQTTQEYSLVFTQHLQKYRALIQGLIPATLLNWRSASYSHSTTSMAFLPASLDNPGVNYDRYENPSLNRKEDELARILELNPRHTKLLLTSSGMAAYSIIHNYLATILKPEDTVLVGPNIYFETDEQISNVKGRKTKKLTTHDAKTIAKIYQEEKPKVIYLDPLTNSSDLRMTDMQELVTEIEKLEPEEDVYIVVDGTMLAGEANPFAKQKPGSKIKILYYESCSKYLQLGLDIAMGGLVAFPAELTKTFDRTRRNTGTIMYDNALASFPNYDADTLRNRMQRFARNAILIGDIIENDPELSKQVTIAYPMRPNHPDYEIAKNLTSAGAVITINFTDPSLQQRDSLNSFIDTAIMQCTKMGIPLNKGVSFGFSIPRISAAAAMSETSPPFLRLSVGDRSIEETKLLANALIIALKQYINSYKELTE